MGILPAPSARSPWEIALVSAYVSIKNCCSVCDILWGSCTKVPLFGGPIPWMKVLNLGYQMCVQTLYSSGEAGSWKFLSGCMALCQVWWLWRDCVLVSSTCFCVGVFSFA